MGVVYRAVDVRLDRTVALKVLAASATGDPERRRRFIQEAKAASALNHPNIITIYEIDQAATAADRRKGAGAGGGAGLRGADRRRAPTR